jgi:hypothetical protein
MHRTYLQRAAVAAPDDVVNLLTTRQHLRPHEPLREVLQSAMDELGCCPLAIRRAVEWLQIDPATSVGRLRRCELIQLGKSISRFWRQTVQNDEAARRSAT